MELGFSAYIRVLNIGSGKFLAALLVLAVSLLHATLYVVYGWGQCKGLFYDGTLKDDLAWQPTGCMVHSYTKSEASQCFDRLSLHSRRSHLAFVGDSRMRQLYHAVRMRLQFDQGPKEVEDDFPAHHDLGWEGKNVKLDFHWVPVLNASALSAIRRYQSGQGASIIVFGAATHTIKESNFSEEALAKYQHNLTLLRPKFEHLSQRSNTKVLWMQQPPVDEKKLSVERSAITNTAIWRYNAIAAEILSSSPYVNVWTSLAKLCSAVGSTADDGLHMTTAALEDATKMLLNLQCNDVLELRDGSCCRSDGSASHLQILIFLFFFVCFCLTTLDYFYTAYKSRGSNTAETFPHPPAHALGLLRGKNGVKSVSSASLPVAVSNGGDAGNLDIRSILWAFTKLGAIVLYFFVCDRTSFFMKENKHFTALNFWSPVLYVLVLGIFFHEESKSTRFLHREQTDEWKGWMQLVILIYHVTGASQSLPIYMHVRALVSSYIFLNAYGHFFFVWSRENTSFERYLQVMFRMNFLTVVLCLAMGRTYQAYYFVPLISFWFTVQYVVMATPPKITAKSCEVQPYHYVYLVIKIVIMISAVSILYMSEIFFENVFLLRPWKSLFVTSGNDIREWWFRWRLDRYSMIYGFCFAFVVAVCQRLKLFDDSHFGNLWPRSITWAMASTSLVALAAFSVFAASCGPKENCNEVHPYLAFVPIVGFILLRNMAGCFRTKYSSFFAWFGRISLELFIAQYHIWLAADTYGVLVLLPNYPVANTLLTSFVFVCAAHEIHEITTALLPLFVPSDKKTLIRNLTIGLLLVIPIGFQRGML